ncbi:ABC transporter substrate-binding protein [Bifidobacterium canis]|uniref:ABC transporter substrate-binding protein n=1 Tax=Bifidobacterium canis TaxID=2610880 RepID=A0A7K1J617_9BIFI|nr:ABC transporter substrate-binding protein [Bifidobacterium canis]MUH60106.1 ABC transporter substrate-binding protein [Bifidobacterium canis]
MAEHSTRNSGGSQSKHPARPWIVFLVIVAVLATAAGAGWAFLRNDGGFIEELRGGKNYSVGLLNEPTSIDVRTNSERAVEQALVGNVYQTLVTFNSERAISANIAARWTQSTDGLRYTFQLRDGVTFSDGTALTANSVVASLQQTISNNYVGASDLTNISKVENVGDSAVAITLSAPNPRLLETLAGRAGIIYNTNAANADFTKHSYGSGPFEVSSVSKGEIKLTRNEHYWQSKPSAASVTLKYFTDESKMASELENGDLDVALPKSSNIAQQLGKSQSLTVTDGYSTRKTLLAFNNKQESPFSDEQVRKFTRYAINAADIAKNTADAKAQLSGPISQLQPGYTDLNSLFPFDLNKATYMRNYFYADYFKQFTLLTDDAHKQLGQTLVDQISAIPMPISLEVVDSATLAKRVDAGDYTCALIDMDDPHDYTRFVDGSAMFGYVDGAAQEQYRKALAQTDFKSYQEQLREFDRIVSENAASAWLYTGKDYVAAQKSVHVPSADLVSWRLPLDQIK